MTMQEILHKDYEALLAENQKLKVQNAELLAGIREIDARVTKLENQA